MMCAVNHLNVSELGKIRLLQGEHALCYLNSWNPSRGLGCEDIHRWKELAGVRGLLLCL
jgi:hypothetical protein